MMFARFYQSLLESFAVCAFLLVSASCTLVEERIDHTAGGPNVPADTAVHMGLASTEQPEEIAARTVPPGPLKVTITEAILLSLENNRSLVVQRLNPSIQQTFEDQERAVFDPAINAEVSGGRIEGERLARSGSRRRHHFSGAIFPDRHDGCPGSQLANE
jgi:hypothetical protein